MNPANPKNPSHKKRPFGLRFVMDLFEIGPGVAITALSIGAVVVLLTLGYFIHSAPPSEITISTGPEGSMYYKNALKYADILKRDGVKLNILTAGGSTDNLKRLADRSSHVDVGMVQGGSASGVATDGLVSLGSISYQPLLIFYRGKSLELLSELAGKRVVVGPEGSGTRSLALQLLGVNGITEHLKEGTQATSLLDWEAAAASKALFEGKVDAVFMMSDSASTDILKALLRSTEVHLYSFKQAIAYSRKMDTFHVLELPEGAVDFGLDIPAHDVTLLGPTVELIAKKSLHPALSDLLLDAATEIHGHPGMFQKRGEFPNAITHDIRLSDDASRFYKSGKSFLYRYLPFWLASLLSRVIVVFVPMLVVLIPALKSIPAFFRWRTLSAIRRRYRELLSLEQEFVNESRPDRRAQLRFEFDRIEHAVNKMKIRAAFANEFYGLRGHIDFVRTLLARQQL